MSLYNLSSFILILGSLYFHYEYGMNIIYTALFILVAILFTTISKPNKEQWRVMRSEIALNRAKMKYYRAKALRVFKDGE